MQKKKKYMIKEGPLLNLKPSFCFGSISTWFSIMVLIFIMVAALTSKQENEIIESQFDLIRSKIGDVTSLFALF